MRQTITIEFGYTVYDLARCALYLGWSFLNFQGDAHAVRTAARGYGKDRIMGELKTQLKLNGASRENWSDLDMCPLDPDDPELVLHIRKLFKIR